LHLIAREGDPLEVAPGDIRVMAEFDPIRTMYSASANEDGRRSSFNDQGQIALTIGFTDGSSGIFVFDAVAVPEPTAALLFFSATVGAVALIRRQRASQQIRG
jgi:hypothetical protein